MMQVVVTFFQQLSFHQRLMFACGLALLVAGVILLGRIRSSIRPTKEPLADDAEAAGETDGVRHGWVFTRTAIGYVTVAIGYHLIVWALPAGITDLCVPLRLWFILPAFCAAAVGGAWAMERRGL